MATHVKPSHRDANIIEDHPGEAHANREESNLGNVIQTKEYEMRSLDSPSRARP